MWRMMGVGQIHCIPRRKQGWAMFQDQLTVRTQTHTRTCHTYAQVDQMLTIMRLTAQTDKCVIATPMIDKRNACSVVASGLQRSRN